MSSRVETANRLRAAGTMLRMAWQADRRRSVLAFGLFGTQAFAQAMFVWWLKLLLDGLAAQDAGALGVAAAGMAVSVAGSTALSYAGHRVQAVLRERANHLVQRRLLELVGHTPTLEIHETPEHLDQLEALRLEAHGFGQVVPSMIELFATVVRIGTTTVLLVGVHPLLLVLPLFGLPALLLSSKTGGTFRLGNELAAVPARRASHLLELTATAGGAKEVRLFRLEAELSRRFHQAHKEIQAIHRWVQVRSAVIGVGSRLVFLLGYFGAIGFVVARAIDGRASIGDAVLTAILAGQVLGLVSGSAELIQLAVRNLAAAGRFVYLSDVAGRARARVDPSAAVPQRLVDGIRLENVSYRYPHSEVDALHDVNVCLPAGATVAVVGDNGAGKTTLVKLLAGLYLPATGRDCRGRRLAPEARPGVRGSSPASKHGRITVDGIDLAALDPDEWRRRISAGFQDHARFEFVVRETVGIGDLAAIDDSDAVRSALDRAGAADLLSALPDRLDTQLGPSWPDGVDLSGGQWQKLAIGRAMMRTEPLLLLLDEPTAALDADTEHLLFERWTSAAAGLRRTTGAVTVLVSHRFSTVRMADLIVVLDGGEVVETGDHTELIARGGLYAELFELQARSYR